MIVGVFGSPLGLDFNHSGVPGKSLWTDFHHFRAPRRASGAKICNLEMQHFNFPKKRKTAPTWSRPAEIFRSKCRFLNTPSAFLKQKLVKVRPSTRGSKCQEAGPPCAGSNRVSSNTFLTGALPARSASMVRSASGYRGDLRFLRGSAAVVFLNTPTTFLNQKLLNMGRSTC